MGQIIEDHLNNQSLEEEKGQNKIIKIKLITRKKNYEKKESNVKIKLLNLETNKEIKGINKIDKKERNNKRRLSMDLVQGRKDHKVNNNKLTIKLVISENKEKNVNNDCIFNKELCKSIFYSLPIRKKTTLEELKHLIKSKTIKLSRKEKAYIIYMWICLNIEYDKSIFSGKKVDCSPYGAFNNGKTVCSGYSKLFIEIGKYVGINIEYIYGYAKGYGYEPGDKMEKSNHEYNAIQLDDKWYLIDSTWGAGRFGKKEYKKEYNEFYFCVAPELLIQTHFPEDEKWQLTEKKYTLKEFLKWPLLYFYFNKYGFEKYFPEEGYIEFKEPNSQKFIVWGKNMNEKKGYYRISFLKENFYYFQRNLTEANIYKDRFEAICHFNKKGRYKVELFSKFEGDNLCRCIIKYIVLVDNDYKK